MEASFQHNSREKAKDYILFFLQILRWEPPISPFFEVQFQEPHAKLGPMMIAAINIVFRPAALENYYSSVQFRTLRVCFSIKTTA
jgi:hypothetical protein